MSKVLYISEYRKNVQKITSGDRKEFWKEQNLYDRFFDYEGQMVYDDIVSGKGAEREILNGWGCKDETEFLDSWRGNSDDAYERWIRDNGL